MFPLVGVGMLHGNERLGVLVLGAGQMCHVLIANQIREDAVEHMLDLVRIPLRILLGKKLADRAQVGCGQASKKSLAA